MTTVGDLVQGALNHLVREQRTTLSVLEADLDEAATTVALTHPFGPLSPGDLIGLGYEVCYVVAADPAAHTVTVIRGHLGTTPAAHPAGSVVYLDARFFPGEALTQVRAELLALSESLFAVSTVEITVGPGDWMVPVDLDHLPLVKRVLVARRERDDGKIWLDVPCRLIRNAPGEFGANALRFDRTNPGGRHQVVVAHGFFVDGIEPDTDLAEVGLAPYMVDAVPFGVAYRLLGGRDAQTSDRSSQGQGMARDPNEMQPLASVRTAEWLRAQRDLQVSQALTQLLAEWSWGS